MSLVATAAVLTAAFAGTVLAGLGLRRRAVVPDAVPQGAAGVDVPDQVAAQVAARVQGLLSVQTKVQADALAGLLAELRAEIGGLKSDVEWLAGERMIEQAIALARSGVEAEEIGAELGLSRDAAETIVAFRRH